MSNMYMDKNVTRRKALASTTIVGTSFLAGCIGDSEDDSNGNDQTSDSGDNGDDQTSDAEDGNDQPSEPQGPGGDAEFALAFEKTNTGGNDWDKVDELVVNFETLTFHTEDGEDYEVFAGTQHNLGEMEFDEPEMIADDLEMAAGEYESATLQMPVESATLTGDLSDAEFREFEDHEIDLTRLGDGLEILPHYVYFKLRVGVAQGGEFLFLDTARETNQSNTRKPWEE